MQDLTPDMEDLLRRASEAYPLKQGEDKWDAIASRISTRPGADRKKQKTGWRFIKHHLVLLLILLFGFLYLNRDINLNRSSENKAESTALLNIKNSKEPAFQKETSLNYIENINETDITNHIPKKIKRTISEGNESVTPSGQSKTYITGNLKSGDFRYNNSKKLSVTRTYLAKPDFLNYVINEESILTANKINVNIKQTSTPSSRDKNIQINKGFYYGLVSGIHINAIKDQEFSGVGFDVGMLAGFRLNNKLSVESGLLFSKRSYWTAGRYFSKEGMSTMPSGMEIMELHGTNKTIEIPVHLRYDLLTKKTNRFFTSVGVSSFIVTNENNQYHTKYNGTEAMMYASYEKDRRYFAASIDVAMGYEKVIGKKNQIRFEPYIQLPVKGVGVGLLPVKSYGLRVSLTRSLH